MSDKDLLEMAAKAAGMSDAQHQDMSGWGMVRHGYDEAMFSDALWNESGEGYWNPLTDDGDALRLAVKLGIEYGYGFNSDDTIQRVIIDDDLHVMVENNDPYAATRRAIVRAAAEIGKAKP